MSIGVESSGVLSTQPSSSLRNVPWQIWVVVALLVLEAVSNLLLIPVIPAAAFWLLAKCLFIVGLVRLEVGFCIGPDPGDDSRVGIRFPQSPRFSYEHGPPDPGGFDLALVFSPAASWGGSRGLAASIVSFAAPNGRIACRASLDCLAASAANSPF